MSEELGSCWCDGAVGASARSKACSAPSHAPEPRCETHGVKVDEAGSVAIVEDDVLQLDVAVVYAPRVEDGEGLRDLHHHTRGLEEGQREKKFWRKSFGEGPAR